LTFFYTLRHTYYSVGENVFERKRLTKSLTPKWLIFLSKYTTIWQIKHQNSNNATTIKGHVCLEGKKIERRRKNLWSEEIHISDESQVNDECTNGTLIYISGCVWNGPEILKYAEDVLIFIWCIVCLEIENFLKSNYRKSSFWTFILEW